MKKYVFLLLFMLSTVVYGQTPLENFLSNPAFKDANVGVYVLNLTTGKTLYEHRSNFVIPPASTQKIVTTSAALELLGQDFTFCTYLETEGEMVNGVLQGNLYIRGTGDPTLGSSKVGDPYFLTRWVQALKRKGITQIKGNIIADASFFDLDAINPRWVWEDIGNYYAAGVYALPYMDNTLNYQLSSTTIGQKATVIKTIPQIDGLVIDNHILCTNVNFDGAVVHGIPYDNKRYLSGRIPANQGVFGLKGDIPNPPLLLAQHFKKQLQKEGITVSGVATYITEHDNTARTTLYEHYSEPLSEILKEINQNSNNLYAEQLFRYLGSKMGTPCTIANSVSMIQNCWRNRGVNLQSSFIMDGCGLAPQDAISAQSLVNILTYMYKGKNSKVFIESFPVAGQSGTLKGFLRKTELEGNVQAKSGTTSRIKSYAGYMTAANGDVLVFAVIVNNAACKVRQVTPMIENFLLEIYK